MHGSPVQTDFDCAIAEAEAREIEATVNSEIRLRFDGDLGVTVSRQRMVDGHLSLNLAGEVRGDREEAPESVPFTLGRTTGEYRASGTLTVEEGFWSELERSQRALIRETMMAADRRVAEALQAAASPVDADLDTHAELFYGSPRRPAETDQQLRQRLSDMWQTMTPPTGDTVDFVVGPSCSLTAEQLAQVRCIVGAEPSPPFTIDGVEVDPEVADHDLPLLLPLIGRSVGVEELTRLTRQLTWNGSLVQERRLVRRQDEDGVVVAWTRERRRGDVVVV